MEGLLVVAGFIAVLYGSYLVVSDVPLPPAVKGAILIALGFILIAVAYLRMRRKWERENRGTGVGYA